jgi:predicted O-methyltransferase YrrM
MASTNIKADGRVQLVDADANQFLPQLEQTFDAIFIDGNKSSYPFYLKQSARLLKTGGMLIVDDALLLSDMWLNSNTSELSSMQKGLIDFNLELSKSRFFQGLALPMFHGIAIAIRSDGRYIE